MLGFVPYSIDIYDLVHQTTPPDLFGLSRARDTIPFSDLSTKTVDIADTMSFTVERIRLTLGDCCTDFRAQAFAAGAMFPATRNTQKKDRRGYHLGNAVPSAVLSEIRQPNGSGDATADCFR